MHHIYILLSMYVSEERNARFTFQVCVCKSVPRLMVTCVFFVAKRASDLYRILQLCIIVEAVLNCTVCRLH
jgi:hypothetical protein